MASNPLVTLFYRRLVEIDTNPDPSPILDDALRLLVQLTSARAGYVELLRDRERASASRVRGLSAEELAEVRTWIATRPVAHSISKGQPYISQRRSVARGASDTPVLLVPVMSESPVGVVYLQRIREQQAFGVIDEEHAKLFARCVARIADELLPPQKLELQLSAYKRRVIRRELRRNGWNMTLAARSLGMGRAALYRALRRP